MRASACVSVRATRAPTPDGRPTILHWPDRLIYPLAIHDCERIFPFSDSMASVVDAVAGRRAAAVSRLVTSVVNASGG